MVLRNPTDPSPSPQLSSANDNNRLDRIPEAISPAEYASFSFRQRVGDICKFSVGGLGAGLLLSAASPALLAGLGIVGGVYAAGHNHGKKKKV